ncbi:MAG: Glu/Leu/Phe/Val dehydrogenase [bacterium]
MAATENFMGIHPQEFVDYLKKQKIRRFYFVFHSGSNKVVPSHPELQAIAEFIETDQRDFMRHEGLFFQISQHHDTLQGAFVHRTVRGQGAGGVRFWQYNTLEDYLRDGLRLSKGMTRKNALAGLWWGGGKGVMAQNPDADNRDPEVRAAIYRDYGALVTSIRGCYVTAEDVGTNVSDMQQVFSRTRFTTCIPPESGGSGNPSIPTARGVLCGMEAALKFIGEDSLRDKIVAVQGMGNVGGPLIQYLTEKKVKKIIACDIDANLVENWQKKLNHSILDARVVARSDHSILHEACDILAPCATGAILNPEVIPQLKAKIICGAANNQLEDAERDDRLLFELGIWYVPDFLTNRMGIVNCANEQYGYVKNDPHIEKHLSQEWQHSIYQTTLKVFRASRASGEPPARVAMRLADEMSLQPHPIFRHRGQQIIDSLVTEGWHEQESF